MIVAIGTLFGGLGLFLLGMMHLTEGLKQSAGKRLDHYLQQSTSTKVRGFFSGFTLTSLVQSSSVVTVAIIGFANAGLLGLGQSAWVVFGSNVGTTMTGWIVALVGFKIKIELFALPLVGLGAFMHILGKKVHIKALGGALAGFGLLFVGLDMLQGALEQYEGQLGFLQHTHFDIPNALMLVAGGFLMTVLMQSSSASMAMILTLVNAGAMPLTLGAAAVIGANIGTTSTALLATIGATSVAKRVAWSHVTFNLVAATAAVALLPLVSEVFHSAYERQLMGGNAAFWLAIYHSLFNLLGVILMIPLEPRISKFLERRFTSQEAQPIRLQFIDKTTMSMPPMAAPSVYQELSQIIGKVCGILHIKDDALGRQNASQVNGLLRVLDGYVVMALRQPMNDELARVFSLAVKCSQSISNVLMLNGQLYSDSNSPRNVVLLKKLAEVESRYYELLKTVDSHEEKHQISAATKRLSEACDKANSDILAISKSENISGFDVHAAISRISYRKRIGRLLNKIVRRLRMIERLVYQPSPSSEAEEQTEEVRSTESQPKPAVID